MLIIKIGGGQTININYILEDLSSLQEKFIIIHGANYLMDEFCKMVEPVFDEILTLSDKNQKLAQARDLLLPRLMSGEIEV